MEKVCCTIHFSKGVTVKNHLIEYAFLNHRNARLCFFLNFT